MSRERRSPVSLAATLSLMHGSWECSFP